MTPKDIHVSPAAFDCGAYRFVSATASVAFHRVAKRPAPGKYVFSAGVYRFHQADDLDGVYCLFQLPDGRIRMIIQ